MPDITMKRERTDRWTKMRYLAPGPAGRQHHVTCSPRWTASPLHPSLSFRYTHPLIEAVNLDPDFLENLVSNNLLDAFSGGVIRVKPLCQIALERSIPDVSDL